MELFERLANLKDDKGRRIVKSVRISGGVCGQTMPLDYEETEDSVKSPKGPPSPKGPSSPRGPATPKGPPGPKGPPSPK
jgi:hypothetical protein